MSSFYHGDAAAAAVVASSSFQVEKWPDPKGLIKSIDVLEAIRFLGSGHKHDGGRVENVVPAPWWGEASATSLRQSKRGKERKKNLVRV